MLIQIGQFCELCHYCIQCVIWHVLEMQCLHIVDTARGLSQWLIGNTLLVAFQTQIGKHVYGYSCRVSVRN